MPKLKCNICGRIKDTKFRMDVCKCGGTLEDPNFLKNIEVPNVKSLLKRMGER